MEPRLVFVLKLSALNLPGNTRSNTCPQERTHNTR
jgi:hypothetical protein